MGWGRACDGAHTPTLGSMAGAMAPLPQRAPHTASERGPTVSTGALHCRVCVVGWYTACSEAQLTHTPPPHSPPSPQSTTMFVRATALAVLALAASAAAAVSVARECRHLGWRLRWAGAGGGRRGSRPRARGGWPNRRSAARAVPHPRSASLPPFPRPRAPRPKRACAVCPAHVLTPPDSFPHLPSLSATRVPPQSPTRPPCSRRPTPPSSRPPRRPSPMTRCACVRGKGGRCLPRESVPPTNTFFLLPSLP